jgi:hypothetical protein
MARGAPPPINQGALGSTDTCDIGFHSFEQFAPSSDHSGGKDVHPELILDPHGQFGEIKRIEPKITAKITIYLR